MKDSFLKVSWNVLRSKDNEQGDLQAGCAGWKAHRHSSKVSLVGVTQEAFVYRNLLLVKISVADPFQFDTDSDPRIRFVEKRIRILNRTKIEKIPHFSSSDYPKKDEY